MGSETTHSEKGFTIIEIVFAIVLLAGSLVVIIGLQTSVIQKALRDRNQERAALIARSVMTAIEDDPDLVDLGEQTVLAAKLLKDYGIIEPDKEEQLSEVPDEVQVTLKVEDVEVPIPLADPVALRRVYLRVFWDETPDDQLELVYFFKE